MDYWSYKSCKAPVKSSPPTNQHPVILQAGCPSSHPKHWREKISHSMDLLSPSSPGGLPTLSLTTNSSWLPWPLISPLTPVPQYILSAMLKLLIIIGANNVLQQCRYYKGQGSRVRESVPFCISTECTFLQWTDIDQQLNISCVVVLLILLYYGIRHIALSNTLSKPDM